MKTIEWDDEDINYWRLNKDLAKQLYEDWHDLMDKYNISDSALIIGRIIDNERVNALTMSRGEYNMFTLLHIADQLERRDDVMSNEEIDKEENDENDLLNRLIN